MQRPSAKRRIGSHAPIAAIVLSQGSQAGQRSRAGFYLVLFMRLVAALSIVEGLLHWKTVLGPMDERGAFMALPVSVTSTVVFFAIIDLVAAVGLWLATPWGGVIWLVSIGAQILVAVVMPDHYPYAWLIVVGDLVLVSLYMRLTWQAALASQGSPP